MRKLRLQFLVVLGLALAACGGEPAESEPVDTVTQGSKTEPKECVDRICPAVVDPVCGSDGAIYDNWCIAECVGVKIVDDVCCTSAIPPSWCDGVGEVVGAGSIADPLVPGDRCNCPAVIDPVCGVDGKTYGNACEARCAGVKVDYEGECRPTMCPQVWDPVCGVDGNTYGNACMAAAAGVEVAHDGECLSVVPGPQGAGDGGSVELPGDDRCICPTVIDPVCGVDGKTYDNACYAACVKVDVDYEGECKE